MKKDNKDNSIIAIIFIGTLILAVFIATITKNILLKNHSNSEEQNIKYIKVGNKEIASIESIEIKDNTLLINTSGDAVEYCAKTTKSTPSTNNICWKKLDSNKGSTSIYKNKKYYIWIKDSENNISQTPYISDK